MTFKEFKDKLESMNIPDDAIVLAEAGCLNESYYGEAGCVYLKQEVKKKWNRETRRYDRVVVPCLWISTDKEEPVD